MSTRPGIIITGGAKRVGAALALYFARNGYDIALHYHSSEAGARHIKNEVESLGMRCELFKQDLTKIGAISDLMKDISRKLPHCNALINNASVFERGPLMDTDEAMFDRQFTMNIKAPFFLTQAFAKYFKKGAVINILDTDVVQSNITHFAYLLSKKTLAEFTIMAARALGPGIRVNAVCPGCILPSNQNEEAYEQKLEAVIPLKSHPGTEDVASTAHWLMSQQHMTGQMLFVDGGKHVL